MSTKAKLNVILKADEVVVAEIEDPVLWQRVLAAISAGKSEGDFEAPPQIGEPRLPTSDGENFARAGDSVDRFARSLGIGAPEVQGALDPRSEPPYLHLNTHCWEAMKKSTPKRGPGSLPPIGLAATLLALWFKEARITVPVTQALASGLLATVSVIDKNPTRGIRNTKWLQSRGGGVVVVNPAEISKAQEIAKAFCVRKWGTQ